MWQGAGQRRVGVVPLLYRQWLFMTTWRLVAPLAACAIFACQPTPNQDTPGFTTVVLVRHAEKELTGDDPGLTAQGSERADALAHVVGEMDVAAVYATQYARTRATALPVGNPS